MEGPPIVGRDRELAQLGSLLAAAREGVSSALVVRGEPGIGKTTLLRELARRAGSATTVTTTGLESESDVPFSSLAELLLPLREHLDGLPTYQSDVLAGALGLGTRVRTTPVAVGVATLSLLAAAAETGAPLVACIDDAHWVDSDSQRALRFTVRRLGSEGVLMLFAVRDDHVFAEGIDELPLSGLDVDAVRAIVEQLADGPVAEEVPDLLHRGTGGNPLAIITACDLLTREQLTGAQPLDRPVPVGRRLTEAVGTRLSELDRATRLALVVVAASHSGSYRTVRAALAEMQLGEEHLLDAEDREVIDLSGATLRFRHPILRSAVYHSATPEDRRAAHAALARVEVGATAGEERAWHLAAATVGPDEEVARQLAAAATQMLERGGHSAASTAFQRAAEFSVEEPRRVGWLLEAAKAAQIAGRGQRALALVEEALELAEAPDLRAQATRMRAMVGVWIGNPELTLGTLQREAEQIEDAIPGVAAAMLAEAAMQAPVIGRARLGLAMAQHAHELVRDPTTTAALGAMLMYAGREGEARRMLLDASPQLTGVDLLSPEHTLAVFAALSLAWLHEHEEALRLAEPIIAAARASSAPGLLPLPLLVRAEVDVRRGHWTAAYAGAQEAYQLADELGQVTLLPLLHATLAVMEALQGEVESCERRCREALRLADELGIAGMDLFTGFARGMGALGTGRFGDALAHLERVRLVSERLDIPSVVIAPWRENLIEAYVRDGREDEATELLAEFRQRAEEADNAHVWAVLRRCQALVDPGVADRAFEEALSWHEHVAVPFEAARTRLHLGEHLRRTKRRGESQRQLRSALRTFEDLGAAPWAERAAAALRATGVAVGPHVRPVFQQLTAQELQIALAVTEGATNREVAAALFLSPKTVEYHLGHVYRKLGVRSRTELARRLSAREERAR